MTHAFLTLLSFLFFAVQVLARSPVPRHPLRDLVSRAVDPITIPPACQAQCSAIVNIYAICTTVSCLCTNNNEPAILTCAACFVDLDPTILVISDVQDVLNTYVFDCRFYGVIVDPMTVSGGTAGTPTANPSGGAAGLIPSILAASASAASAGPTLPPSQTTINPSSPATVTVTAAGGGGGSGPAAKGGADGLRGGITGIVAILVVVVFVLL